MFFSTKKCLKIDLDQSQTVHFEKEVVFVKSNLWTRHNTVSNRIVVLKTQDSVSNFLHKPHTPGTCIAL